ncbi:divergent AAA domain protein [bacterium BMS3Abin03]|nr:divergent AAA domain protein [bacterium BMS3Abin03]
MNRKQLLDLIEEGENIQCEFKRHFTTPEKIAKEMMAFANTKGGFILFGVDDDRKVIGVESEKAEAEMIENAAKNFCEPPVEYQLNYIAHNGKEVVAITIPESGKKPHRLQDYLNSFDSGKAVVMIRVNDKSIRASKEMIRIMRAHANNLSLKKYSIGQNEKTVFEYLAKKEKISVKELSKLVNISERRASRTLVKMVRANLLAIHTKDNGEEFFTQCIL